MKRSLLAVIVAVAVLGFFFRPTDRITADEIEIYQKTFGPDALVVSRTEPMDGHPAATLDPAPFWFTLIAPQDLEQTGHRQYATVSRVRFRGDDAVLHLVIRVRATVVTDRWVSFVRSNGHWNREERAYPTH